MNNKTTAEEEWVNVYMNNKSETKTTTVSGEEPASNKAIGFTKGQILARNDNGFLIVTEEEDKIRKFGTGAIRDSENGKEDYTETISWTAFRRYAEFMTENKKRYGGGNFKLGIPIEAYERSLIRHLSKYMINKYEKGSLEPNVDHLSALLFNIFGIMHEEEMGKINNSVEKRK